MQKHTDEMLWRAIEQMPTVGSIERDNLREVGLLILLKIFAGIVLAIVAGSATASPVLKVGLGEAQYCRSPLFTHSRSLQRTITRVRIKWRDEKFRFTVVGFMMGLSLPGIVALLSLIPIQ